MCLLHVCFSGAHLCARTLHSNCACVSTAECACNTVLRIRVFVSLLCILSLVKVQWLSHLSLWRRQIRVGTGPGTANMKHLLPSQKLWLLKGSIHHWTSVLWFDTIVQILPFSPLSPHFLASDLFPFLSAFFFQSQMDDLHSTEKMQRLQHVQHAHFSLHSPQKHSRLYSTLIPSCLQL